tara:strand:- start:732 stop:1484 length:753 start_codon:yes stop_codon:yes gene_type:complete
MKEIIIFDVDGTLVESGSQIEDKNIEVLKKLKKKYELALCGGGKIDKILHQMKNKIYFNHYFTECGCVYDFNKSKKKLELENIYIKNLREHPLYCEINILIKEFLKYLSNVSYEITGHFVDLRNGIVYLSCIGMQATLNEREKFKALDLQINIRNNIINILKKKAHELGILSDISINIGGSVGIGVYPKEYDKIQILKFINKKKYSKIYYFGDKYSKDGNDYEIINDKDIIGHKIDNVYETYNILKKEFI